MSSRTRYIIALILIHTLVMLGILTVVIILGVDYHELLLLDDGYYAMAGDIVKGKLNSDFYGFGYSCVLTWLFMFPQPFHPFLRLLTSILFTCGTILLVYRIFSNYFKNNEIFWGVLISISNPLYVHWMFKSRVEAPLVFLLGLVILFSQNYLRERKYHHLLFASLFLAISVATKPVLMLIPYSLLIVSLLLKSKRIFILAIVFAVVSIGAFWGTKRLIKGSTSGREYYKVYSIVNSAFYVDAIIRYRDFKTQYLHVEDEYGNMIRNPHYVNGDKWVKEYEERYKSLSPVLMSLRFIYEKPGLVLQLLFANTFLVFSLSSSEFETLMHFVVNCTIIIFAIYGMVKVKNKSGAFFIHLAILLAIYALLVLIHSRGPYFTPIIPYLFAFAGRPLNNFVSLITAAVRK